MMTLRCLLLATIVLCLHPGYALARQQDGYPQAPGNPKQLPENNLESVLNPDGSIRLDGGSAGSFSTKGWRLKTDPDGTPRFLPDGEDVTSMPGNPEDFYWDDGFSLPGPDRGVVDILVDGTDIYICGPFTSVGSEEAQGIAKWDGSSWQGLGSGIDGTVRGMVMIGGILYAAGSFTSAGGIPANSVAGWNGGSWSSLGLGITGGAATVTDLDNFNGSLVVGGYFTTAGGVSAPNIAIWNGSTWSSPGGGMNDGVTAVEPDGIDLYAGGYFTTAGGNAATYIAKWNGAAWSAVGAPNAIVPPSDIVMAGSELFSAKGAELKRWDGSAWGVVALPPGYESPGSVLDIAEHDGALFVSLLSTSVTLGIFSRDGGSWSETATGSIFSPFGSMGFVGDSILVGGGFEEIDGISILNLACWDGVSWSRVGDFGANHGASGPVHTLVSDGASIFAAGEFSMAGDASPGEWTPFVAKWDGNAWSAIVGVANDPIYALAIVGSDLYVGGAFEEIGGVDIGQGVARWDGSAWSSLDNGTVGKVYSLATDGVNLYVGGSFEMAGEVDAKNVAMWDGSSWSALGDGTNGDVYALAMLGTYLYAGGDFNIAGFEPVSNIAVWRGASWGAVSNFYGTNGPVYALAVDGDDVYLGGSFTEAGTLPAANIARLNTEFTGTWYPLGSGVDGEVRSIVVDGTELYAGGVNLTIAGGTPVSGLARWDGSAWWSLGSGVDPATVYSMAVVDSSLFVGGDFPSAGGKVSSNVARWHIHPKPDWLPLLGGVNGVVNALAVIGTDLYVGGSFTMAGITPANNIAKWDGTSWSALGSGIAGGGAIIYSLANDYVNLYAGGDFTTAGGVLASNIARWNGSVWEPLGTGTDGPVHALLHDGRSKLYAGGEFSSAGGTNANNVARCFLPDLQWFPLAEGVNGRVMVIINFGASTVALGGWFTMAGDDTVNHVAFFANSTFYPIRETVPTPGTPGVNGPVFTLLRKSGVLMVGGGFTAAGGHPANNLAFWSDKWYGTFGTNDTVRASLVSGKMQYYGGKFSLFLGQPVEFVAKSLFHAPYWGSAGTGLNDEVRAMAIDGTTLYVGGQFTSAGPSNGLRALPSISLAPASHIAALEDPLLGGYTEIEAAVSERWNLVSSPVTVEDSTVSGLFPAGISSAFGYEGTYEAALSLSRGKGYWLKFPQAGTVELSGTPLAQLDVTLLTGWNLIGSVSEPVAVADILSDPEGMATSPFFGYENGYVETDSIRPGKAYWVKVDTAGSLYLYSVPDSGFFGAKIRIVPTGELPPAPPADETVSDVEDPVPARYALDQNYPNPFNPATTIRYHLPERSRVLLEVYNVLGQRVATLVDETQEAGTRTAVWEARGVPSGVYYSRLKSSNQSLSNRMLILR